MKMPLALLIGTLMIMASSELLAQDFKVPTGLKFDTQEDFTNLEPDILKFADFVETAPLDDLSEARKNANAFFIKWLTGTAHVNIALQPYVTELVEKNKPLLIVYLAGWTRLALQSPDKKPDLDLHLAAVRSVLKAYKQCSGATTDDQLEELATLDKDGKLADWLKDKLGSK